MNLKEKNYAELVILSLIFLFLCVAGMAADFSTGLLASGIDGIMFFFVCLLMALVFLMQLALVAVKSGWLKALPLPRRKPAATAPAASPVSAEEKQGAAPAAQ